MSNFSININESDLSQNSYEVIPAGTYATTVFNVELTDVKNGDNAGKKQYKVQLRISEGQYENRRLFTYIPLYTGKAFWKTQSFFEALGYDVKGGQFAVPTPNELAGKPVGARVKIAQDRDGVDENNVAGFNAPASTPANNLASVGATPVASNPWATGDTF